jgi:hypothetical protein
LYVCVGFLSVAVLLSPKSQKYDKLETPLFGLELSENEKRFPDKHCELLSISKSAMGLGFIVIHLVELSWHPNELVNLCLTKYFPELPKEC